MSEKNTKFQILNLAEKLCQDRGFNGFSYHDLSKQLGIKTSSIHYHYPTKADLGVALIKSYQERFSQTLKEIEQKNKTPQAKLKALMLQMAKIEAANRLCLCAMLTSDFESLPGNMHLEIAKFFSELEGWVEACIIANQTKKLTTAQRNIAKTKAQAFVAVLHGILLSSRATKDGQRLKKIQPWLLDCFTN